MTKIIIKPLQRDFTVDADRAGLLFPGLVPAFVRDIVERLEDMGGLDTEGLYRVPADRKKRQELLKCFDANYKPNGGKPRVMFFPVLLPFFFLLYWLLPVFSVTSGSEKTLFTVKINFKY